MESLINTINNTLNHKLSLSNMELYHSNLLARVLEKYKGEPFSLLEGVIEIIKHIISFMLKGRVNTKT